MAAARCTHPADRGLPQAGGCASIAGHCTLVPLPRPPVNRMDRSTLKGAPSHIATARLDLFHPQPLHAAAVRESVNASLPALRHVAWAQQAFGEDDARRFCDADAARVAEGECLIYFAFERSSGRFIGNLDLHSFDFAVPRCQLGFVGDTRFAGRGLMREAALMLIDHGYELGVERIEAWCDVRNTRSIHFAQTLGLHYEGLLRGVSRDPQGALCDEVLLARLRGDGRPS